MHERIVGKSDIDKIFMALTLVRNSCCEKTRARNYRNLYCRQLTPEINFVNNPEMVSLYTGNCLKQCPAWFIFAHFFCIFGVTFAAKWTFSNILKENENGGNFVAGNGRDYHMQITPVGTWWSNHQINVSIWGKDTWNGIEQKVLTSFSLQYLCPCLDKNGKLLIYAL